MVRAYIRPGFVMTHLVNPILARLRWMPALIVRGRRSGRLLTIPMGEPLDLDGRRYLVSGRGETEWVRNLRACRRAAFRLHGRSVTFRPTEVLGQEHDDAIDAYRRKLGRRVDVYFSKIPESHAHPVFRIDPISDEHRSRPDACSEFTDV